MFKLRTVASTNKHNKGGSCKPTTASSTHCTGPDTRDWESEFYGIKKKREARNQRNQLELLISWDIN